MYENNELVKGATSGVVAGAGIVTLPNTGDNTIALILSVTAVTIGVLALLSQLVVRILRSRAARANNN